MPLQVCQLSKSARILYICLDIKPNQLKTIIITPVLHRNKNRLLVKFGYDSELISLIRKVEGATFSATHKSWHVADNPENRKELPGLFKDVALVDATAVFGEKNETCLPDRQAAMGLRTEWENGRKGETGTERNIDEATGRQGKGNSPAFDMLDANKRADVLKFKYWMKQKRYSESTIKTYIDALKIFFRFFHDKPIHKISNKDLLYFNNEYIIANKYSATYQSQIINAVKLFYKRIQEKDLNIEKIERPRKQHKLPNVLSKEEITAILKAPKNIKHKAMLSLIYSCGLRRSELLNLKPADVDSKRNLLIIRNAKGFKDRVAPLSDKIIEMLRNYFKVYKPKVWLFEGQNTSEQYSEQSLSCVLKQALEKTKIKKPVSLHWLRHSYATHLLEAGTDLRYIQEILGHKSSRTTEIYTHVSSKSIQKIISPFDDLNI